MPRYVSVTLTEKEAFAVILACQNYTMDIADTPNDQLMLAAVRARKKLVKLLSLNP
jgi:hypothetical protein